MKSTIRLILQTDTTQTVTCVPREKRWNKLVMLAKLHLYILWGCYRDNEELPSPYITRRRQIIATCMLMLLTYPFPISSFRKGYFRISLRARFSQFALLGLVSFEKSRLTRERIIIFLALSVMHFSFKQTSTWGRQWLGIIISSFTLTDTVL